MGNYIFMLRRHGDRFSVDIYERSQMFTVSKVIPLPQMIPEALAACGMSNCVYVLSHEGESRSVYRLKMFEDHVYIEPFVNDLIIPESALNVSQGGRLLISSNESGGKPPTVRVFEADGSLEKQISFSRDVLEFTDVEGTLEKPNGNLVLVVVDQKQKRKIVEVDENGTLVRQFTSNMSVESGVNLADSYGRIILCGQGRQAILLDDEFNILELGGMPLVHGHNINPLKMAFNRDRREIVLVGDSVSAASKPIVSVFRCAG